MSLFVPYFLECTYKRCHMIFVFPCVTTSQSMTISRSIHVAANGIVFILFYGRVIFHCVYVYHIILIRYSVNGHWGCFHVLAIVNSRPALSLDLEVRTQRHEAKFPTMCSSIVIWAGLGTNGAFAYPILTHASLQTPNGYVMLPERCPASGQGSFILCKLGALSTICLLMQWSTASPPHGWPG